MPSGPGICHLARPRHSTRLKNPLAPAGAVDVRAVSLWELPMQLIRLRWVVTAPSSDAAGRASPGSRRTDADGHRLGATDPPRMVWLRQLLGRAVLGPERQHLGHVDDVVAQGSPKSPTPVSGLILDIGGEGAFVPVTAVRGWTS